MNTDIPSMLSNLEPFRLLPEAVRGRLSREFRSVVHPADRQLRVQGETPTREICVVHSGSVEWYFEENGLKLLHQVLRENEAFGLFSILLGEENSLFSTRTLEQTRVYELGRTRFRELFTRHQAFADQCLRLLGRRFLNPTFAGVVNRIRRSQIDVPPLFLKQSAIALANRDLPVCDLDTPVGEAARLMTQRGQRATLVKNKRGEAVGLLTDEEIRGRVVAGGYSTERPVRHVMTTPSVKVEATTPLMRAIPRTAGTRSGFVAVAEGRGDLVGVLERLGLSLAANYRPVYLLQRMRGARDPETLVELHAQLPHLLKSLIYGGLGTTRLSRTITLFADTLLESVVRLAIDENGEPPVPFAFLQFGSKGRGEQTLCTHQDNGIVFADPDTGSTETLQKYFLKFAKSVCEMLREAGYEFCPAKMMATNPAWCQPLSRWKTQFREWVTTANAERVLRSTVFFDFRAAFGEPTLATELRRHAFDCVASHNAFLRQLAEITINFRPPTGIFKGLEFEMKADHRNTSQLRQVMTPIVHYARYCALRHRIDETGTLARLHAIHLKGALPRQDCLDMAESFSTLMRMRLIYQTMNRTGAAAEPENLIHRDRLTEIDEQVLKELSKEVVRYQEKADVDASRYSNPFSPHREVLRSIRRRRRLF